MDAEKYNQTTFSRRLTAWLYRVLCWCVVKPAVSDVEPNRQSSKTTVEDGSVIPKDDAATDESTREEDGGVTSPTSKSAEPAAAVGFSNISSDWQLPEDYPTISLVNEVMAAIRRPQRIMDRFWSDLHSKPTPPGTFPLLKLYTTASVDFSLNEEENRDGELELLALSSTPELHQAITNLPQLSCDGLIYELQAETD